MQRQKSWATQAQTQCLHSNVTFQTGYIHYFKQLKRRVHNHRAKEEEKKNTGEMVEKLKLGFLDTSSARKKKKKRIVACLLSGKTEDTQ